MLSFPYPLGWQCGQNLHRTPQPKQLVLHKLLLWGQQEQQVVPLHILCLQIVIYNNFNDFPFILTHKDISSSPCVHSQSQVVCWISGIAHCASCSVSPNIWKKKSVQSKFSNTKIPNYQEVQIQFFYALLYPQIFHKYLFTLNKHSNLDWSDVCQLFLQSYSCTFERYLLNVSFVMVIFNGSLIYGRLQ